MAWAVLAFALFVLALGVMLFNGLVSARNQVRAAWSDIDVQLKRRYDLVPQLVTVVQAYADYERATLITVAELRARAIAWGRRSLWFTGIGIVAVSLATPLVSPRIFEKWFSLPNLFFLMPIPLLTGLLFMACLRALVKLGKGSTTKEWVPFVSTIGMFVLAFGGLAFSIFPYLVIDQITLWEAASAPGSLKIMLFGAAITLPVIIGYNFYCYRVFWGKTSELNY